MTPILGIMASSISGSKISTTAYESIASATGTGASGTITFSSIPSTYASLQIRMTGFTTAGSDINFQIAGNNLTYSHYLYGDGTTAAANANASSCYINWGVQPSSTQAYVAVIDVLDYASTTKTKTVRFLSGVDKNGSGEIVLGSGLRNSTSAVSSISLVAPSSTWTTNTTISLYGIKGA